MFGGDLPWLKGLMGLSPVPAVMSVWSRGIWIAPTETEAGGFLGLAADECSFTERTAASDAVDLATPGAVLKDKHGVTRVAVLPIMVRRDIIPCILHMTMCVGRLAALYVMRLCSTATMVQKHAVNRLLKAKHVDIKVYARGQDLRKPPSIKGCETKALFEAWEGEAGVRVSIAETLGVAGTAGDHAMRNMFWLLRTLYRTRYRSNPAARIEPITLHFRDECVHDVGEHLLYLYVMKNDIPGIVDHLWENRGGFGLGMFSQDIPESMNRMLKDSFVSFSNRGGGREGRQGALRQAWQRFYAGWENLLFERLFYTTSTSHISVHTDAIAHLYLTDFRTTSVFSQPGSG